MNKVIIGIIILALVITLFIFFSPRDTGSNDISQHKVDLEISVQAPERTIYNPYSNIFISSNNSIEIKGEEEAGLAQLGNNDSRRFYSLRINNISDGDSKREIILIDEFDQEHKVELTFHRDENVVPPGFESIDPWTESVQIIEPNILSEVNKNKRLAEDYEPSGLIDLNKEFGIYTLNDATLEKDAAFNLNRMWNDLADELDEYVTVVSGYRSWTNQFRIYAGYIRQFGEKETDTFSARPGHSEHQLGTAIDISNKEVDYQLTLEFGQTKSGKWLKANAYKYGFINSYTEKDKGETGFEEPWHYRYIGIDNAKEVNDKGLTLYEFLKSKNG